MTRGQALRMFCPVEITFSVFLVTLLYMFVLPALCVSKFSSSEEDVDPADHRRATVIDTKR